MTDNPTHIDHNRINILLAAHPAWAEKHLSRPGPATDLVTELSTISAVGGRPNPTRPGEAPPPSLTAGEAVVVARCLQAWMRDSGARVATAVQYGRAVANQAVRSGVGEWERIFPTRMQLLDDLLVNTTQSTANKAIPAFKALTAGGRLLELLDDDPIATVAGTRIRRVPRVASDADLAAGLTAALARQAARPDGSAAFPKQLRDLVLLDIKSYGLRSCEMAAMRWSDFDDGATVTVRASKTPAGIRAVRFSTETAERVAAYKMQLADYLERTGRPVPAAGDPLWVGVKGGPMTSRMVSAAIGALLPDGVRPHMLRGRIMTKLSALMAPADVAATQGVDVNSLSAYLAVADPQRVWDTVARHTAAIDNTTLGIAPSPTVASADRGGGSPCWLPEGADVSGMTDIGSRRRVQRPAHRRAAASGVVTGSGGATPLGGSGQRRTRRTRTVSPPRFAAATVQGLRQRSRSPVEGRQPGGGGRTATAA